MSSMLTITQLADAARSGLPEGGMACSTVLPILAPDLYAAAFWFPARLAPPNPTFYPPRRALVLDVYTGRIVQERDVEPGEIGPDLPKDQPLPDVDYAWGFRYDAAKPLYAKRDAIAPAVWEAFANRQQRIDLSLQKDALELKRLIRELGQPPLFPYYQHIGRAFFGWIASVAGGSATL